MKPNAPATLADWLAAHRAASAAGGSGDALLADVVAKAAGKVARGESELASALALLDELGVDSETLAATIAYAAGLPSGGLPKKLPALVEGLHEAEKVWALYAARGSAGAAEGLRRLLLSIIGDLRVVFVLLALQLARLRHAAKKPEAERRATAQLAADIHAPLANRLGIWQFKWELEDLGFRYLQPDNYKRVARLLDERREDRERFIATAIGELSRALREAGIRGDVAGRPKHMFSIWKKMQRKAVDFEHLYDIRAVRVLVDDIPTCYAALGVVHSLWPPVPSEFDDYIARPKGNQYQSLHTAVIGPGGKTLEVQIRTPDMHAHSELGVAAHWRYKEGGAGDAAFERKIAWMRSLLDSKGEADDDAALMAGLRSELVDDRVYVLTPQGKVVDLPRTATVLDFAYHVHTEVGHRCRGAKVNGRIANLQFQPQSGDTIEILTGKVAEPRRDWLVAGSPFLNTHRAREKVRAWFKKSEHERNVVAGREIVEKELRKLALSAADLEKLAPRFHLKTVDDVYVAVGIGEVSPAQISRGLHELIEPVAPPKLLMSAEAPRQRKPSKDAIVIEGVGNLLTVLARCCQPVPGEPIIGWLTRGRGVSIHRDGCRSVAALIARDPARLIHVQWGSRDSTAYEVEIVVQAYDRKGLLKDVSTVISNADAQVVAAATKLDPTIGLAEMSFVLRVADFAQLSNILHKLSGLPNVLEARRTTTAMTAPPAKAHAKPSAKPSAGKRRV